jgi:hypothetical protein
VNPADLAVSSRMNQRLRWEATISRSAGMVTEENPFYPGIRCAMKHCAQQAQEGYFFCSTVCRDRYVASRRKA